MNFQFRAACKERERERAMYRKLVKVATRILKGTQ